MRAFLRETLREMRQETSECANGADALTRYREFRPALVLMDICMSGMDGIHATELIMEMDADANIVIVTEHDERLLRDSASTAGARRYFLKDDLTSLLRFVRKQAEARS